MSGLPGPTLTELIALPGASFARVKRWKREGLLPPAIRKGRYSYYPREAIDLITRIVAIQEANMTLRDIKDRLRYENGTLPDDE